MRNASLWEREQISRKEVPTLQEVFAQCDQDLLVRAILEDQAFPGDERERVFRRRRHETEGRVQDVLASLCSLPVKRRQGRRRLIMPIESYELLGCGDVVKRRIGARLLLLEDASAALRACNTISWGDECDFAPERPLALEPWDLLLASRVWLGGSWSVGDRYRALAAVFWDMTYFGYSWEEVAAAQAACGSREEFLNASTKDRANGAEAWGLTMPDPLEPDPQSLFALSVEERNAECQYELCRQFVFALEQMAWIEADEQRRQYF